MADEDKLLGIAQNGRTTERTYSEYRIDYDSADSVAELTTVDVTEDGETVTVSLAESNQTTGNYFSGALKNPPAGYPGHEAKDAYQRKVLVEDEATRDEVESVLTNAGVSSQTEDVAPTEEEKEYIVDYGAESSLEVPFAMQWMESLQALDAGTISQAQFEQWNNSETGSRQVPTLSVEDGLLANNGTETETVTISHPYSTERTAVLAIGDDSFEVTLTPGETYMETITTTKAVGTSIEVGLLGNFIGPDSVTIEVTE